ncbi:MAG: hypothetical protein DRR08_18215 [Candidatus Parabeggiatoa sp. nov. 2]|nr:MAG: hypothetical protein B6247_14705 [Beggiatoa sp. 4572_84]RKZ57737.1 MAG: hypothetical protein DRR08_18215 [Gammaproteobacteria bacterium]
MDEQEFQQARERLNQCPCPFEKAVLSSRCGCANFQRLNIAEREAAACILPTAQERCALLLEQLYQNARFALKQPRLEGPQPHAKAMKVQCGGLLGLQAVLVSEQAEAQRVADIDALVTLALETFGELDKLPYQEIVKFISNYQVRGKRS